MSAHLFFTGDYNHFLITQVKPLIQLLNQNGQIDHYFFIRYADKGPHIRLRLQAVDIETRYQVKAFAGNWFEGYFKSLMPKPPVDRPNGWFDDYSLEWIDYEPETDRYGGVNGLIVAEQHFCYSSEVVLDLLAEKGSLTDADMLGIAIQLHVGFANRLGMSTEDMIFFFRTMYRQWLPSAALYFKTEPRQAQVLAAGIFENTYKSIGSNFSDFFERLFNKLISNEEFEEKWFNKWLRYALETDLKLINLQRDGRLEAANLFASDTEVSHTSGCRWTIYLSYLHMLNNRLGIGNADEGLIAYLILQTLTSHHGR